MFGGLSLFFHRLGLFQKAVSVKDKATAEITLPATPPTIDSVGLPIQVNSER
jgi:hypothetical protein